VNAKQKYLPAVLCLMVLGGLGAETLSRPRPRKAEPVHQKVLAKRSTIPYVIGDWRGEDREVSRAAMKLLRPNLVLERHFVKPGVRPLNAILLVVQCKDARDMAGHYPLNCYPAHGFVTEAKTPTDWTVGGQRLEGTRYLFRKTARGVVEELEVANLIVMPNGKFCRGIDEVYAAAGDYLTHFYGAAQIQVVTNAQISPETRQQIFGELIEPMLPMIELLRTGGSK
jgi:hypothetical protein